MKRILTVLTEELEGKVRVLSPAVGLFIEGPRSGSFVRGGDSLGRLQILSHFHELQLPQGARGFIEAPERGLLRTPVTYGEELFVLEAGGAEAEVAPGATSSEGSALEGLQVRATQTGRFYSRPAPDQPAFVQEGGEVHTGQPLGLIEVMKTFTQITYGGSGLPERARVVKLLAKDEQEVRQGEPLMLVEEI